MARSLEGWRLMQNNDVKSKVHLLLPSCKA
jgi:hypothetical protein